MENVNVHKQKLITIIIAAVGLILLFLPWQTQSAQGFDIPSTMGFKIWGGIICAVAIVGVIASCLFAGNKAMPFDKQGKIIAIVCFAIMLLMTIIVLAVSGDTIQAQTDMGYAVALKKSAGIGAWLSLVLQLAGLVWVSGLLDKMLQGGMTSSTPSRTPPPPPPPLPKA